MSLNIIFILISFYGWSLFGASKLKNVFYAPLWGICVVSLIVYFGALLGFLYDFALLAISLGFLFLIYSCCKQFWCNAELRILTIWFVIVAILAFFNSRGSVPHAWDEFTHWSAQLQQLKIFQTLQTDKSGLVFYHYIPGLSILRYLGYGFLETKEESAYYISWLFVYFSFLSILAKGNSFSLRNTMLFIGLFFGYMLFFQFLSMTLYVDQIQAVLLLALVCILFNDNKKLDFVVLIPLFLFLAITKHVGIILGCLLLLAYLVDQYIRYRIISKSQLIVSLAIIGLMCLIVRSWSIYSGHHDILPANSGLSISAFNFSRVTDRVDIIAYYVNNTISILLSKYPHAIFGTPAFSYSTYIDSLWKMIIFTLGYIAFSILILKKNERFILLSRSISLFLICILYILILSVIQILLRWSVDPWSFSRYLSVTLFPTMIYSYVYILRSKSARMLSISAPFLIILFFSLPVMPSFSQLWRGSTQPVDPMQRSIEKLKKDVKSVVKNQYEHLTVLYIYDENKTKQNGLEYYIARTALFPMRFTRAIDSDCLSQAEDQCDLDLSSIIPKIDLILLDNPSAKFLEKYGALFSDTEHLVYQVVKDDKDKPFKALGNEIEGIK